MAESPLRPTVADRSRLGNGRKGATRADHGNDMIRADHSRTIGQGRVVDELIARFTHSIRMDWLLPGIPPTGKRVELPFVVIVQFDGDKLAHEHLHWDQASVLVQVGLLNRTLPVCGGEIAAQVLNPTQPMNELIHRTSNNGNR